MWRDIWNKESRSSTAISERWFARVNNHKRYNSSVVSLSLLSQLVRYRDGYFSGAGGGRSAIIIQGEYVLVAGAEFFLGNILYDLRSSKFQ